MAQDLKEFKEELKKATGYNINPLDLDLIYEHNGEALGEWIGNAEPDEKGHWHGQQHGGINVQMSLVPESTGKDPNGNDYTEDEHYVVFVTLSKKACDDMEAVLGKPVKNG